MFGARRRKCDFSVEFSKNVEFRKKEFRQRKILKYFSDFLQKSHQLDLEFSPRDGIHILQYTLKRLSQKMDHPISKDQVWKESISKVLGEEALDLDSLAAKNQRSLHDQHIPMGLGDFFFSDDNPLHPDSDK